MLTCNKIALPAKFTLAIAGLATLLLFSPALFAEYAPTSVEMEVKKVSEHVYYVEGKPGIATDNEGFISNAGFIITGDGVVIFDSLGTPSLANKLVQKIKAITRQPIKKVVVSHFHADHIYGLQVFAELGAEIIAHPANLVLPFCQDAMQTRCFCNKLYAITANRIGTEIRGVDAFEFTGRSQITSFNGEVLSSAPSDREYIDFVECYVQ